LHMACQIEQPFKSSFAMRDSPLMIRDIIQSRLQSPESAFLSACRDESSPDEAIHLIAAMQLSGFYSVIGYLQSDDED
ncbi:hypothetical protein DFJ58DRAFT_607996, partial [Suillus subalutaceus]|uniref:uncharacterized protein n=1 Tax=Suillus subalutaceus TaxID=48586 RepID=UPI001B870F65